MAIVVPKASSTASIEPKHFSLTIDICMMMQALSHRLHAKVVCGMLSTTTKTKVTLSVQRKLLKVDKISAGPSNAYCSS